MRRIRKVLFGFLTTLCLTAGMTLLPGAGSALIAQAAEQYDLYISGVRVNSSNAANLSGVGGASGNISYDKASNTLYLENAQIPWSYSRNGVSGAIVYAGDKDFTIIAKGENVIWGDDVQLPEGVTSGISAGILLADPDEPAAANRSTRISIIIEGGGSISAHGGKGADGSVESYGLYSSRNVMITGAGDLNLYSDLTSPGGGMKVLRILEFYGRGKVLARGRSNGVSGTTVYVYSGDIKAESVGTENGCFGMNARDYLEIRGGTLEASAVSEGNASAALSRPPLIYSELAQRASTDPYGTNEVPYESEMNDSYQWYAAKLIYTVMIQPGAHMTADGGSGALTQEVVRGRAITDVVVTADDGYYFPKGYESQQNGIRVERFNDNNFSKKLRICGTPTDNTRKRIPDAVGEKTDPELYVGGVRVDAGNAGDLSRTGRVKGDASYDAAANTLYLRGAEITGPDSSNASCNAAIVYSGPTDFRIEVSGNNTITAKRGGYASAAILIGNLSNQSSYKNFNTEICINEGGTLTVQGGPCSNESYGIWNQTGGRLSFSGPGNLMVLPDGNSFGQGILSGGKVFLNGPGTVDISCRGIGIMSPETCVNRGTLKVTSTQASRPAAGLSEPYYSGGTVNIVGGTVQLFVDRPSYYAKGIKAGAINITGGTTEIRLTNILSPSISNTMALSGTPVLGAGVTAKASTDEQHKKEAAYAPARNNSYLWFKAVGPDQPVIEDGSAATEDNSGTDNGSAATEDNSGTDNSGAATDQNSGTDNSGTATNENSGTDNSSSASAAESGWTQDKAGWHYVENGVQVKSEWRYLPYGPTSYWYYFDGDGIMKTGWLYQNGSWYYLNPNSDGWCGRMLTGWQLINGSWYYLEPEAGKNQGHLYVSTTTPDGYRVDADGVWIQ